VKEDDSDPVPVGGTLVYSITRSSSASASFTVTDRLPSTVLYLSGEVSKRPGNRSADCIAEGAIVRCYVSILPSAKETATIAVIPIRVERIVNRVSASPYEKDFVNFVEVLAGLNAAGVVGTEIAVSQAVASEVAERFYREFTGATSQSVGTALYRVRIDLLKKGNVTGLTYTPFCSMDLALARRAA
jgi:hypothetical protein